MTITEIEHDIFERMAKNNDFQNNVAANQETFKAGLLQILLNSSEKQECGFILGLLKLAENGFYILPLGNFIQVFTKDFKGTIAFNLRRPNENHAECFNVPLMIEVDSLHSKEKGYGKKLMNSVINIANTINVPLCLWTETQNNTLYFKKYGFKTYGKRGKNQEELLIKKRVPSI